MDDSEHEPLLDPGAVVKTRSLGLAVVPGMTRMVSLRVPLQTAERNAEGGARPLRLVTVRRARRRRRSALRGRRQRCSEALVRQKGSAGETKGCQMHNIMLTSFYFLISIICSTSMKCRHA